MGRALAVVLAIAATGCAPRYTRLTAPTKFVRRAPAVYQARFETTKGPFVIEVRREWAPIGADRFYNLVRGGYYDGARFFRTLPKFVVQWGISPNPAVTKTWGESTRIKDDPVKQSNTRGFVTFATSGADSRTTQVYVNMANNARLDKTGFSPFGKIVRGMDVFDKLHADYGEGAPRGKGPDQKMIREEGEPYLARDFPLLDKITRARIVKRREAPSLR